jgi:hypothetical protein
MLIRENLLSRDTFEGKRTLPISLNRYIYVESNPLTKVDPSGFSAMSLSEVSVGITMQTILYDRCSSLSWSQIIIRISGWH